MCGRVDEGGPASGTISTASYKYLLCGFFMHRRCRAACRRPVCRLESGPVCLSSSVCLPVCRLSPVVCLVVWASCMGRSRGGVPLPWASACVCFGLPVAPPISCAARHPICYSVFDASRHIDHIHTSRYSHFTDGFLHQKRGFSISAARCQAAP